MSIITRMLKQTAAYWAPLPVTTRYGKPSWASPIDISVRWEDVNIEFMDAESERQMSRARVFVDRDVEVNGVLLLDGITSSTNLTDPKANDEAWEIRRYEKLPNLRNTEFLRTALL